jgi:DNA mismatch repair protein MutS
MAHRPPADLLAAPAAAGSHPPFRSLLSPEAAGHPGGPTADPGVLADLRLDQVIEAASAVAAERELVASLLSQPVSSIGILTYRQEVFGDLEDTALFEAAGTFATQMRQVRAHLNQLTGMRSVQQRQGWLLDAAAIYCDAVQNLAASLASRLVASRGLLAFRGYLAGYLDSAAFSQLAADTADRKKDLAQVRYLVRIKGLRVEVSRYAGEADYSAEIAQTFERFRHGAVKDYLVTYRGWPGMNHVGEQILDRVARLFPGEFTALDQYCQRHAGFLDATVGQFERELWFYLAWLDHIAPLRSAGLSFCLPEISAGSKQIYARDTFDLALAAKLAGGTPVVTNDFELANPERIIVVSGPNQGGKTTFARTFGQLHHLAATGCPVPGSAARLYLPDRIFAHFERVEDLANLSGKMEDDLLRIQEALRAATGRSVVIMNEIFTSTTVSDATFLGRKVLEKVAELDCLCVYVTFIDELAGFGPTVVSMAATVDPGDPVRRTYKVVRKPADGLAYALAIAEKHGVTYHWLRDRIGGPEQAGSTGRAGA